MALCQLQWVEEKLRSRKDEIRPFFFGTSSPIVVRDPESDIPVELKIYGNFIPRIVDLEAFILEFMPSHPDVITAPIL